MGIILIKKVNALILAGSDKSELGTNIKALIDIEGKSMIKYVIEMLRQCDFIEHIAVVGSSDKLKHLRDCGVDYIVEGKGSIIYNTIEGVNKLGKEKEVLVCTSDIPMITKQAIVDFVQKSQQTGAALCYPVVEKDQNEQRFPGIERTYVSMKEGAFTGGNLFYIHADVPKKCSEKAEQIISYRKNPFKMATVLGWGTLVLLLLKRLSLGQAQKRFSKIFNIDARVIVSNHPELANDVDKPSDLAYATKWLASK